jgi:hypothetical protein
MPSISATLGLAHAAPYETTFYLGGVRRSIMIAVEAVVFGTLHVEDLQ